MAALVAAALAVVVGVVGPDTVATQARQLFVGEAPPPAADLVAVADRSFLTDEGRALLYASRPRIAEPEAIAAACDRPADDPPSGCFALEGIFVHQPADARVADAAVTTLAHELLHAAYDQLGDGEILAIHDMLEAEIARVPADDPVHEQIAWSVGDHEVSRETELFAYLGSQVYPEGGFAPELEAVYARWFTDRAALVGVFHLVGGFVEAIHAELATATSELAADQSFNARERAQIEADRTAHEAARAEYNADADRFNQIPEAERGDWTATWTEPDGTVRTAALADSLAERLARLERYRVELDERAAALEASEAAAAARSAEVDAQYLDLVALIESAYPGETLQ